MRQAGEIRESGLSVHALERVELSVLELSLEVPYFLPYFLPSELSSELPPATAY